MKAFFDDGPPDVVGWELEEAERAFEGFPFEVRVRVVGREEDGALRVIRQVRSGRVITLTCAPEAWGVDHPKAR